jgi:hypothetical protein
MHKYEEYEIDLEIIQSSIINGKIKSAQIEANKARRYSKIKKGWACCVKKNDDDDAQNQIKKKIKKTQEIQMMGSMPK